MKPKYTLYAEVQVSLLTSSVGEDQLSSQPLQPLIPYEWSLPLAISLPLLTLQSPPPWPSAKPLLRPSSNFSVKLTVNFLLNESPRIFVEGELDLSYQVRVRGINDQSIPRTG